MISALRQKCPSTELFLVLIRENTDQKEIESNILRVSVRDCHQILFLILIYFLIRMKQNIANHLNKLIASAKLASCSHNLNNLYRLLDI